MALDHLNFREMLETTCSAENSTCNFFFMNGYLASLNENKVANRFIKFIVEWFMLNVNEFRLRELLFS